MSEGCLCMHVYVHVCVCVLVVCLIFKSSYTCVWCVVCVCVVCDYLCGNVPVPEILEKISHPHSTFFMLV